MLGEADIHRHRLAAHDHVLLMRTLSKFGLAGVRLGYLVGPAALVAEIDKVRPPYNVSVLNAEAALFALEHADEFARQAAVLRAERALRDPARDQGRMLDLKPFVDALADARDRGLDRLAGWQALRWELEELRVSLFAQELGAKGGVSAKKLAARLTQLR